MKTKIHFFALSVLSSALSFGQDNHSKQTNDLSGTVYVCFSKGINSEKAAFSKNSDLERFSRENKISFTYDLAFTDRKLDEMSRSSQAIGNSGESVEKLKRIYKADLPLQNQESTQKIIQTLERFPEIEYVSVMSSTPVEPPLVNMFVATPDLESLQTYLNDNPGINAKYA